MANDRNSLTWADFAKCAASGILFGPSGNALGKPKGNAATRPKPSAAVPPPPKPAPSGWDPNWKPPPEYPAAYYRWPPELKRKYDREVQDNRERRKIYAALEARFGKGKIPIQELRNAYNLKVKAPARVP